MLTQTQVSPQHSEPVTHQRTPRTQLQSGQEPMRTFLGAGRTLEVRVANEPFKSRTVPYVMLATLASSPCGLDWTRGLLFHVLVREVEKILYDDTAVVVPSMLICVAASYLLLAAPSRSFELSCPGTGRRHGSPWSRLGHFLFSRHNETLTGIFCVCKH